ncbi:hypothetical protein GLX30_02830 [Streptomyces sp. Tu 2975]|uniref:hypothetical protein n=1 Tax=Streptomyces sp. Tu 2975 TaxID=2676871 RepID=UPI001358175F|nr:hypothetical protein [Streptomyces sp. Tu 2975]QIP83189.1 hypothetical protein GLX30_02830 [Streptomyces sp. Tu 2975]
MTTRTRFGVNSAVLCAGLLSAVVIVTGCTENSGSTGEPTERATPTTAPAQPTGTNDKRLGEQAEAALDTVTIDDPEFVESGLESLADGIHTDSPLVRGKSYQLGVACAGQGKAKLSVHIEGEPVVRSFDCDGTAVHQRITKAPSRLRVDVDGEPGSSGMVAWQISETGT